MNTWPSSTPAQQCGSNDGCDLAGFDDLSCTVSGIAAQAEYLKKHEAKLAERRQQFDSARAGYQKTRSTVADQVAKIKDDLAALDKKLCQVCEEDRACLRTAWETLKVQLDECGSGGGCCVSPADAVFDAKLPDPPTLAAVLAAISTFGAQAERVERCFAALVAEPDDLTKRVGVLVALVRDIEKNTDQHQAFAQTLWADYLLTTVYSGFATAAKYEDCLCTALNASLAGRRELARLSGLEAELTCKETAKQKRCTWLKTHVVDEIVSLCLRRHAQASAPAAT